MKIKKVLSGAVFGVALVAGLGQAINVSADEDDYTGWKSENGRTYWYENGEMATGLVVFDEGVRYFSQSSDDTKGEMVTGWTYVDGNESSSEYFFNEDSGLLERESYDYDYHWFKVNNDCRYLFKNGVLQGVDRDNPNYRGEEVEIYGKWYWLDGTLGGRCAINKDVYQESAAGQWAEDKESGTGKWVRYNEDGLMVKEWAESDNGVYYFDPVYGTMAKGKVTIDGSEYEFDEITGVLISDGYTGWKTGWDGKEYWYENNIRQGYKTDGYGNLDVSYRGKEIYDPGSDAWYWLDNIQYGAKTIGKDVYMESAAGIFADNKEDGTGKWVRYDENGRMVKGFDEKDGYTYYFDPIYGSMAKGGAYIDNQFYVFDYKRGYMYKTSMNETTGETTIFVEQEDIMDSGKVGNVSWVLTNDGTLFLAGTCDETDKGFYDAGYLKYYESIKRAYVDIKGATDLSYLFNGLSEVEEIGGLKTLDTSKVTNMNHMFAHCGKVRNLDLENFDTSNVTDMSYMFQNRNYIEYLDLRSFDTSKVTTMRGMFSTLGFSYFYGVPNSCVIDTSSFDTSNVTDMGYMFGYENIIDFDISNFDTTNVTDMEGMFYGFDYSYSQGEKKPLNLTNFDTTNVKNMKEMFCESVGVKDILVGSKWNIGEDTVVERMFENCGTDHVSYQ